jgi:putative membrane protein
LEIGNKKIGVVELVTIVYLVGFIGLSIPGTQGFFNRLTVLNLIASLALLLSYHKGWRVRFIAWIFTCFLVGFVSELIGVNTGLLFGSYEYTEILGVQLFNTPIMVGVLWVIVCYVVCLILSGLYRGHWSIMAFAGASLLTLLDYFIEPVAIKLSWWEWEEVSVPLFNYISWFAVAFFIISLFFIFEIKAKNKLVRPYAFIFVLFFVLLNFSLVYFS